MLSDSGSAVSRLNIVLFYTNATLVFVKAATLSVRFYITSLLDIISHKVTRLAFNATMVRFIPILESVESVLRGVLTIQRHCTIESQNPECC